MFRFISWMAVGIAGAFLVVASEAFSLSTIVWLAFAVSIGIVIVTAALGYTYRRQFAGLLTALTAMVVGAWTIVAALVFTEATAQTLTFASGLALAGLAILGLSEHEVEIEHAAAYSPSARGDETHLSAAA